jgi:hypothetical protein
MKVFVGFGYNDRDKWIKDLVIPFINELGCEVVTGEDLHGEILSQGVKSRIEASQVLIGFLTQREALASGKYSTHRWVTDEIAHVENKKPVFEILEKNVDAQKGITGDRQRYEYDDKAYLLLEITKFIMKQKAALNAKTFLLQPSEELTKEIRPLMKDGFIKCSYTFIYKAQAYKTEPATLLRLGSGLGIIVKEIPSEDALIEICISAPNIMWNSGYVHVGSINVQLTKEQ